MALDPNVELLVDLFDANELGDDVAAPAQAALDDLFDDVIEDWVSLSMCQTEVTPTPHTSHTCTANIKSLIAAAIQSQNLVCYWISVTELLDDERSNKRESSQTFRVERN